jgi:hypothetical protein
MIASLAVRLCLACGLAFAAAGASADDAQWTSHDYVDLYFRYYNGWVPLPHLREKESKALFDHLIDAGNITRIEEASIPDDEKLRQLRIILAMLGEYRAAYNSAVIVGEPLEEELTLVQAYTLQVADHVAGLLRTSPDSGGSPAAWATLIEGVIESVGDDKLYSPAQSATLADAIAVHYPAIAALLPENERRRLRAQVLKLSDASSDAPLRQARERMKRAVLQ